MIWLTVLLAAIGWVLNWLISKNRSGGILTGEQRSKLNRAIYGFSLLRDNAVSLGCRPEGEPDDSFRRAEHGTATAVLSDSGSQQRAVRPRDVPDGGGSEEASREVGSPRGTTEFEVSTDYGGEDLDRDVREAAQRAGIGPIQFTAIMIRSGIKAYRLVNLLRPVLGPGTEGRAAAEALWESLSPLFDKSSQWRNCSETDILSPVVLSTQGENAVDDQLYPYPPNLNMHAVSDVAGFFRGTVPIGHAAHAAWDLAGTGLKLGLPDEGHPASPRSGKMLEGEAAAQAIEALDPSKGRSAAVSWTEILQLLLAIIQKFITPTPAPVPAPNPISPAP